MRTDSFGRQLRDSQRQRVYKAERTLDWSPWDLCERMAPTPERFETVNRPQAGDLSAWIRDRQAWFKAEKLRVRKVTGGRVKMVAGLLTSSDWWADQGAAQPRVEMSTSTQSSRAGMYAKGWTIKIAATPYLSSAFVIAHELAHIIVQTAREDGKKRHIDPGHGPAFCGLFVGTTSVLLGVEAGNQLLRAFHAGGVAVGDRPATPGVREDGLYAPYLPAPKVEALPPRLRIAACYAPVTGVQETLF